MAGDRQKAQSVAIQRSDKADYRYIGLFVGEPGETAEGGCEDNGRRYIRITIGKTD